MGSVGCDGEGELRRTATGTAKKQKLPGKISDAFNEVNHSSVPRKLRSEATKKRCCKPSSLTLPNPKRLNHSVNGFQTTKKDSLKKSKLNMVSNNHQDCSSKQVKSVPISKEEEEVAETLFALAGLLPGNDTPLVNDCESPTGKAPDLSMKLEESVPVPEGLSVPNQDSEVTCPPTCNDVINPTVSQEVSSKGNARMENSKQLTVLSQPNLLENIKLNPNAKASLPVNFPALPTLPNTGNCSIKPQGSICLQAKLSLERLNESRQTEALHAQRNSGSPGDVACQIEEMHPETGSKANGSKLSPGLNPRTSHGSKAGELPLQPLTATYPSWLSTVALSSKASSHVSSEKVNQVANGAGKKSSRCTTHVYVSHLIQSLQISEDQLRSYEWVINPSSLSDVLSRKGCGTYNSSAEKCFLDAPNSLLMPRNLSHDQGASGNSTLRTQGEPEVNNIDEKGNGNHLKSLTKLPIPQLNSAAQHGVVASLSSLPSILLPSNPYQSQRSASVPSTPPISQVHVPLAPYSGRPLEPVEVGNNTIRVMTQAQSQPQQRQPPPQYQNPIWIPQLPSHYQHNRMHFLNWQNNRRQDQCLVQYIQSPFLTSSHPSASLKVPKQLSISQQQHHQLVALGSSQLPPIRAKAPTTQSSVPFGCEENGIRFCHPEGTLPLQLLCNEHL